MRNLILYITLTLLTLNLYAQDISVVAEYPSVVEAGQQFRISWRVNTGNGDFIAPSFTGFYKLMGPQQSYSSSTQLIQGKLTQETTLTYTYYLQALEAGKFVIPPAGFRIKNKTVYSDSARIEVVSSAAAATAPASESGPGKSEQSNRGANGRDIFVDVMVNKKEVFAGEHIIATVKLFTRIDIAGINEIKYPSFINFLKTDIETPPLTSLKQENINGTLYGTGILQQFILYPQVTGELTIDPVELTVLIRQQSGNSDPFFGDFFATYTNVPRAVISNTTRIKVNPLPGSKPDNFSGITGNISIKSSIDKDSVGVNDAITYKIIISGSGNLRVAAAPVPEIPSDIEVYDPKITDNLKNSQSGTSGQRVFEFLLIPRHHGDFRIPPVRYSFFNLATGKYESIATQEFNIHVVKGSGQEQGIAVFGGTRKEDVKYLGKDIRFIKSNPGRLKALSQPLVTKGSFYSAFGFSILIFFVILLIRKEHIKRNADTIAVRNRKAARIAAKRLKIASECLRKGEPDKMYDEILKALWGYLSDKLSMPLSELTRSGAIEELKLRGADDGLTSNLESVLDSCEYARYAPSSSNEGASKIYESAAGFIKQVENLNN